MEIIAVLLSAVLIFGVLVGLARHTNTYVVGWSDGSDSTVIKANTPRLAYKKFLDRSSSDKNLKVIVCHRFSKTTYDYDPHLENLISDNESSIPSKDFPCIGITDRALIAREAINYFPYEEFEAVSDILEGKGEKRKAIEELNLKIRTNYENFLFEVIGEEFDHNNYKDQIDEEVEKIMQLGIRGILKKYGTDSIIESVEDVSREIKSSESWDEIKRRL